MGCFFFIDEKLKHSKGVEVEFIIAKSGTVWEDTPPLGRFRLYFSDLVEAEHFFTTVAGAAQRRSADKRYQKQMAKFTQEEEK